MKYAHEILLRPIVTEKSMLARENNNQYAFKVNPDATKLDITNAVEKAFSVKVVEVRTVNVLGKKKRRGRLVGKRADWKKAIVRLAQGDSIKYFEGA
ncbi:MAG: 50S ribosomal protein L23 [Candidatus Adiutrix sp.]|jgi:large subunit ribosomal protein L23|nr:50S ribosomal protein L23 [Candidatus Adiutrix sp.]